MNKRRLPLRIAHGLFALMVAGGLIYTAAARVGQWSHSGRSSTL